MVLSPESIVNKQKKTIILCQETMTKNGPRKTSTLQTATVESN